MTQDVPPGGARLTRKGFLRGLAVTGAGMALAQSPLLSGVAGAVAGTAKSAGGKGAPGDLAGHVNPFVGTAIQKDSPLAFGSQQAGNTQPGAVAPFGMVTWGPDTVANQPGGYSWADPSIRGFSLTHISGGGCDSLGDFPFMPFPGEVTSSPATTPERYASAFSHQAESASPGYYGVRLDNGTKAEFTATQRTGTGRFSYPGGTTASLLVDVSGSAAGASAAEVQVGRDTLSGWAESGMFCGADDLYRVYFWAEFDQPFKTSGTWSGDTVRPGGTKAACAAQNDGTDDKSGNSCLASPASAAGTGAAGCGAYVTFDGPAVEVRVGISFTSLAGARANLRAENHGSFEAQRARVRAEWNERLGAIRVEGGEPADLATFYTALYHCFLHPNVFSDASGEYSGFDGKTHRARSGHAQYANFSGWDVYRSQIQLLAMLAPRETSDMMQSMVNGYAQSGQLPKWSLANGEAYIMVGDPAAPILADAYAFGARDFDVRAAVDALVAQATKANGIRPGIEDFQRLGYLPADRTYEQYHYGAVSTSLEYNTADFAVAELARQTGDKRTAAAFDKRAQYWRKLFNPRTGYIQARNTDGSWAADFDPASPTNFVEGNATQYTWMVPFDVRGLFDALGGDEAVRARLDTFFTQLNAGMDKPYAWMGNEPNIPVPYLYAYAGAPYRTQEVVRRAMTELYTPEPGGLPGNDDLGTMSAWYVWSALGMFPQVPGRAELVLASPLFRAATVRLGSGRTIEVHAPHAARDVPYVQGLLVNGRRSTKPWLPAEFVHTGGKLDFSLASTPDRSWGSEPADAPPSFGVGGHGA
ncbi:GH92 family glycosyl hydrolase [Streptomyces sp. NBC_01497]|uniref:GH92 family glycosyl hydrolase n=1 Tax=Streptomyces sp. NBC_01497 TaxID=2903885 RepID=UPI002E33F52D|nr:GH92 family glycosyl hydrolase [Streptomyces sp. NBC_01497]